MPPPRVFVSSVFEGYEPYRDAAREGILAAGMVPLLVNEDLPSLAATPRNACLDGVASCDIYVVLIGDRAGWTTPSGKPVIEEEYDFAKGRKMPVLAFLQDVARDVAATAFATKVSDYTTGQFRRSFTDSASLEAVVLQALKPLAGEMSQAPTPAPAFASFGTQRRGQSNDSAIRLLIAPARNEELVSPQRMEDRELEHRLLAIAHESDVSLLSYTAAKSIDRAGDTLRIIETTPHQAASVSISFTERGVLDVTVTVPRARPGSGTHDFGANFVIAVEEIESVVRSILAFYGRALAYLDPYGRHQQFFLNVLLADLGFRALRRAPLPSKTHTMRMATTCDPIIAYETPRLITLNDLIRPDEEIARVTTLLERGSRG